MEICKSKTLQSLIIWIINNGTQVRERQRFNYS